ncbi:vitamin K epoxide reductase family protein [Chiayiivirga flava]|uniref:Putative membrane protein n=1 Tax=Chiayiivirga flava TaxID=659595 RepID=A0A7W8D4D9_9GAMM|nr:vitamin K epoxide reductase family protein [Chiayiivirga flava]MBB5207297.1 putative membrane protein [Chiayiivirga flava]
MAKQRRARAPVRSATVDAPEARRVAVAPEWIVVALAAFGLLLTGYLTAVAWWGTSPALCTEGSGCDLVQHSRWSTLLGLPMALWGFGLYLLIGLVALQRNGRLRRWRRLWTLSLVGVLISLYLTVAGLAALDAVCVWCLLSFATLVAIFVVVVLRRPSSAPGTPWQRWLIHHAIVLLPFVGVLHAWQSGLLEPPENPRLQALAIHLEQSGAKFYGAFWCPNCQSQKDEFGASANRLPYVECSPNGRNGGVAFECSSAAVTAFPTWDIRGQRFTSVLSPEELARHSRFAWNAPRWTASGDEAPR